VVAFTPKFQSVDVTIDYAYTFTLSTNHRCAPSRCGKKLQIVPRGSFVLPFFKSSAPSASRESVLAAQLAEQLCTASGGHRQCVFLLFFCRVARGRTARRELPRVGNSTAQTKTATAERKTFLASNDAKPARTTLFDLLQAARCACSDEIWSSLNFLKWKG
jgi:hypothetical protein